MKKITLLIIGLYQSFISATLKNVLGVQRMCRFSPTCSEYTKAAICKHGVFHGIQKSVIRLLRCQPFVKF